MKTDSTVWLSCWHDSAISDHILATLWHNQRLTHECAANEPLIHLKRRASVFIDKGSITAPSKTSAVVWTWCLNYCRLNAPSNFNFRLMNDVTFFILFFFFLFSRNFFESSRIIQESYRCAMCVKVIFAHFT